MANKDNFEPEQGIEDSRNHHSPNIYPDWRVCSANLINTSMGLISPENPLAVCKGDVIESSSCSLASMVDSFCPTIWDQPISSQSLGFSDVNVQNDARTALGSRKASLGHPRTGMESTVDTCCPPPNSMLGGNMPLPTSSRMLPQSLSQFPADLAFIDRAARFSCFGAGNLSDMMSSFSIPESTNQYSISRGMAPMLGPQGPQDVFPGVRVNSMSEKQSQKNETGIIEGSKDMSLTMEPIVSGGSPLHNERKSEGGLVRCHDEAKQALRGSADDSDEAESSGGGGQAEPLALESTGAGAAEGHGAKKRKRISQDTELDQGMSNLAEATRNNSEIEKKGDENPTSTANRPSGKHGKQGSPASGSHKEEFIHVRAKRGQATNSHSLAERVRREKISERMKFLQDLVPGCSKVTGKAVMLDEIINYVQSLQRQVEFLSMKLATVNPQLDFNVEGLLAKDILQSRGVPSSVLGFPSDMSMPYPPLYTSQPGPFQAGLPGTVTSLDALRRTNSSQLITINGGHKESTSKAMNVWEDELHDIIQTGINSNMPPYSQDLDGPSQRSHMKADSNLS